MPTTLVSTAAFAVPTAPRISLFRVAILAFYIVAAVAMLMGDHHRSDRRVARVSLGRGGAARPPKAGMRKTVRDIC